MSQTLISVPPHLRDFLHSKAAKTLWTDRLAALGDAGVYVGADPGERKLGSGGGTANLLVQAWRASRGRGSFESWLAEGSKLILHSGGESRRLPAYAALGKAFMPLPAVPELSPARFDQMLADFQISTYRQVLEEAGPKAAAMVTAGDVWLDFNPLQVETVSADITGIGMQVSPEVACHFGVYFVEKGGAQTPGGQPISFFLQKPSLEEIYRHATRHDFYVDSGMWLLSLDALKLIMRRCGWSEEKQRFGTTDGNPRLFDLYTELGCALGTKTAAAPTLRRLGWSRLSTAVIALHDARFYHLGSTRQLFDSFDQIQRGRYQPQKTLTAAAPFSLAANVSNLPVWLEGVESLEPINLDGHNALTGLPAGTGVRRLGPGWCLDVAPLPGGRVVLRPYHIDDTLRGTVREGATICGRSAAAWLKARSLQAPDCDIFRLEVYPILRAAEISQEVVDWFFADDPDPKIGKRLAGRDWLAAGDIPARIDFQRYFAGRAAAQNGMLLEQFEACLKTGDRRVFEQDFGAIARHARRGPGSKLGRWLRMSQGAILKGIGRPEDASRFLVLLATLGTPRDRRGRVDEAYRRLQSSVVAFNQLERTQPKLSLKSDQIVWARSPVRLDLAGGWTDTPPYCFAKGGTVLNVAMLLNGQPPIQVFVRPIPEPIFRLHSIDLGSTENIASYATLASFHDPRSRFSLPKAALALAGFHPDFAANGSPATLRRQLQSFGGGLELSLLSAVPKGSGLGTSSILGATLLAALNRTCALGWDEVDLYKRVLGIEQLLTTGGGWQDQAGALFRGLKLIETQPGLGQAPAVRYLPAHLLGSGFANESVLLYYTGVTRLAKGILREIVRDMFLGDSSTLRTLELLASNARQLYQALQEDDPRRFHRCIARSWTLNRRLDPSTTTREIDRIIAACGADLAACKLLGAGGGGYMLLCARNAESGRRIRARLESAPHNSRARFIDFAVAERALEVTVS